MKEDNKFEYALEELIDGVKEIMKEREVELDEAKKIFIELNEDLTEENIEQVNNMVLKDLDKVESPKKEEEDCEMDAEASTYDENPWRISNSGKPTKAYIADSGKDTFTSDKKPSDYEQE